MFAFLLQNLGTILVGAALLAVVAAVSVYLFRSRKKGKSVGCGGCCSGCPGASYCHRE
ncbi:MAG TPA: FeoB-associated Cys-rich membrane protein [Oscillospiraceae bacterium]|nr:FeoB-associated Cys-rich membrane protein [Oscillospiraceae bacterium]